MPKEKIMNNYKLFLLLSFYLITTSSFAAEMAPAMVQKEEAFTVSIEGQEPFTLTTKRSTLEKLGMIKSSFAQFPDDRNIALRGDFSRDLFEQFIQFLGTDCRESHHDLKTLLPFLQYADSLQLDEKYKNHITQAASRDLFGFHDYNLYQFERQSKCEYFKNYPRVLSALIKKILLMDYVEHCRYTATPTIYNSIKRIRHLRKQGVLDFDISIHELCDNPLTKDIPPIYYHSSRCLMFAYLTSLEGIERIQVLKNAEELNIENNLLTTVEPLARIHLPNLKSITLVHNDITTVAPTTFAHCPLLKKVDLRDNPLENPEEIRQSLLAVLPAGCEVII